MEMSQVMVFFREHPNEVFAFLAASSEFETLVTNWDTNEEILQLQAVIQDAQDRIDELNGE